MPLDPVRVKYTRSWFERAAEDLRAAALDTAATPPLLRDSLFHCQQAVEKALKGFLMWHDIPFRKTHDLAELANQSIQVDPTLEPLSRQAIPLTEFAWRYRYPGEIAEPTHAEAKEALALAREAVEAILQRLPPEVRP